MNDKNTFMIVVLSFTVVFLTIAVPVSAKFNMSYLYFGNPNQWNE
ncbi:MAG TPA: hypothetical protein VNM69_08560 [Bacillus sp. (in: firmicutes)]|nr:hypothetical protein [Bacillus sp. (in: firmicutes)]